MLIKDNILVKVTDFDISYGTFVIPRNVTIIGPNAFKNCNNLKNIKIPTSVEIIDRYAFCNCENLINVNIENAMIIGDYAFYDCINLTNIRIPNSVTEIGAGAFKHCFSLHELTLPESIKKIESSTFKLCENLTSINFSNNITIIDKEAFCGCFSLKNVTIPEMVRTIGDLAFCNCTNLEKINIPKNVEVIGKRAFAHCSNLSEINIPNNVKEIEIGAFSNCTSLKTIILSNKLTEIKSETFCQCESLNEITIPINVKTIQQKAFYGCINLKNVNMLKNVISIESIAFSYCKSLEEIIFPEKLIYIGIGAFSNCTSLKTIKIPNSTNICESVFADCTSLKEIILPEDVLLDCRIFQNCISLEKIDLSNSLWCRSIPNGLFSGCINLVDIKLPNYVDVIGEKSFYNCKSLKTINIPITVQDIGERAFSGCDNLENIDLSSNLNEIHSFTFCDCTSLKTIKIPITIQDIGEGAFCNCKKLNNITISNKINSSFHNDVFQNCTSLKDITVLSGLSNDLIMQFKDLLRINLTLDTSLFFIDINHLKELSIESLMIYNTKTDFYTIDLPLCTNIDRNLYYTYSSAPENTKLEDQLREIREEELQEKINYALLDNYISDPKCFKISEHKKFVNRIIKNVETIENYDYRTDFDNYIKGYISSNKPKELVEIKNIQSMLIDINNYKLDNKSLNNSTEIEKYGNELLDYSFLITNLLSTLQTSSTNNIETINLNKILSKITKLESRNPDEISKLVEKVFFDVSVDGLVLNKTLMNKMINYTRYKVCSLNDEIKGFETLKEIIRICIEKINECKDKLKTKEITDGEDLRLSNIDNNSIKNNTSKKIDTLNNSELTLSSLYEQINNLTNLNQMYINKLKEIVTHTLPSLLQNYSLNNIVLKDREDIETLNSVCDTLRELIKLEENSKTENNNLEILDEEKAKVYKK